MPTFLTSSQLLNYLDSQCQDWWEGHQNHHFLEIKNANVFVTSKDSKKSSQCNAFKNAVRKSDSNY